MKTLHKKAVSSYILLIYLVLAGFTKTFASDIVKNLPLVFDPLTKKYFINGNSKFLLKQGDKSSLIDRIEVSADGGEYRPYGEPIQFKDEGKHTLKFRALNPVNNWSPVQFIELFVDLTEPSTEAKFSANGSYKDSLGMMYVALKSNIELSSQDNLSGIDRIEYSLDNQNWTPYLEPIQITKPGRQAVYYRAVDRVGNVELAKVLDFTADGTPPVSVVHLKGQGKPTTSNGKTFVSDSIAFELESSDDSSKVKQMWVSVDNRISPYIKPIYFLQEGSHTLKYYSVDNVGNKEVEKTLNVYTVSTPPQTLITTVGKIVNTGGINFATPSFQLKLSAQDNIVGLDRIEVKVDQDPEFKVYLEPIDFKSPGIHTVAYRAVDRVGNYEPIKTFSVSINGVAPETTLSTAQPLVLREGVTYSPAPNIVTFNVSNSIVGVAQTLYSINEGPFAPYQGPITLNTDRKITKISYKSVDKLGNEEQPKFATFHMMNAIPVVDLFVSDGKSKEEQVRTHFLEQSNRANVLAPAPARMPSSDRK